MSPPNRSTPSPARGPALLARAIVVVTVLLIGLGGMVTSTGSGMAFRDWPLADGSLWPGDMELAELLEHSHRALATLLGLMVLTLTIWVGLRESRAWLRKLTVGALGLVVVQGIIGGLGVLENLPVANSTAHGILAQLTLCTLATVAFSLSPVWGIRIPCAVGIARTARKLCAVAVALVLVQILVGAVARHGGSPMALWTHAGFSMVVALAILFANAFCSGRLANVPGIGRNTRWTLGILLTQLLLGFVALTVRTGKDPANIDSLGRSALLTSHVIVGTILLLVSTLLMLRVFRNLDADDPQAEGAPIP